MLRVIRRAGANYAGKPNGNLFLRVLSGIGSTKDGRIRSFSLDVPKTPSVFPVIPEKLPDHSIADMATKVAMSAGVPKPPRDGPDDDIKEAFRKFKEKQKKFQKNDGLPVFLKAGIRDRILFNSTIGLTILGLGMQVYFYYNMG